MHHLRTTVDVMNQLIKSVMPEMEYKLDSIYKVARGSGNKLPVLAVYSKMPNLTQGPVRSAMITGNEGDLLHYSRTSNPLLFMVRMIPDFEVADRLVDGVDQEKYYLTLQVALVEDDRTHIEKVLVKGYDQCKVVCGVYITCANLSVRGRLSPSNVDAIPIGLLASLFSKTHSVLDTVRKYAGSPDFNLVDVLSADIQKVEIKGIKA